MTTGLSEQVQERLRALAETFARQLPDRLAETLEAGRECLSEGSSPRRLPVFRNHVHKLAGSAATFGYHHVTACAKRLEHLLDGPISTETVMDSRERHEAGVLLEELAGAVQLVVPDADVEDLERVDDPGAGAGSGDQAAGAAPGARKPEGSRPAKGSSRRRVVIAVRDRELAATLEERFGFYGFVVILAESVDRIAEVAHEDGSFALVLDLQLLSGDPHATEQFGRVRETLGDRLRTVVVSDLDDFTTRLSAVRSGGSSFFASPVDTGRLVDTVDNMTLSEAGEPYHVVIVDDDVEQCSYHAMVLQQAGMITSVVSDPQHIFQIMIESKPDLLLLDMYMPGCDGLELAGMIRQQEAFVSIPIVYLSVETDQDKQFDAVSRGGDGFLCKPIKPDHLVSAVTARVERTRSMRFYMERDSLTGLLNHTNLMYSLSKEIQRAERVDRPVCFAMLDVDHFKAVNDTYGHLTGDRVLVSLARFLQERLRKTDIVGRYGGEEFGVVLFNVDLETAVRVMDKLREQFAGVVHDAGETQFSVTFSCGIADYPRHGGPGLIREAADAALFAAKESGRNRVVSA